MPHPADGIKEITANSERAIYWLSTGAQPSDRVAWLFGMIGTKLSFVLTSTRLTVAFVEAVLLNITGLFTSSFLFYYLPIALRTDAPCSNQTINQVSHSKITSW